MVIPSGSAPASAIAGDDAGGPSEESSTTCSSNKPGSGWGARAAARGDATTSIAGNSDEGTTPRWRSDALRLDTGHMMPARCRRLNRRHPSARRPLRETQQPTESPADLCARLSWPAGSIQPLSPSGRKDHSALSSYEDPICFRRPMPHQRIGINSEIHFFSFPSGPVDKEVYARAEATSADRSLVRAMGQAGLW